MNALTGSTMPTNSATGWTFGVPAQWPEGVLNVRVTMRDDGCVVLTPLDALAAFVLNERSHRCRIATEYTANGFGKPMDFDRLLLQHDASRAGLSQDGTRYTERSLTPEQYDDVVAYLKAREEAEYRKARPAPAKRTPKRRRKS